MAEQIATNTGMAAALVAVAAEIQNPAKTAPNPFFKSQYAPLDEILAAVRPLLAKHGLAVVQGAQVRENGQMVLVSTLIHTSGETFTTEYPLVTAKSDPQGMAAAVTYARRYSLTAMLNIVGDDDDDGNTASGRVTSGSKATGNGAQKAGGNGAQKAAGNGGNGANAAKAPASAAAQPAPAAPDAGGNGNGKLATARAYVMPFGTQKRPDLKGQTLGALEDSEPTLVDFLAANTKNADLKAALDVIIAARQPQAA